MHIFVGITKKMSFPDTSVEAATFELRRREEGGQ
jgi:hypothetical protein